MIKTRRLIIERGHIIWVIKSENIKGYKYFGIYSKPIKEVTCNK